MRRLNLNYPSVDTFECIDYLSTLEFCPVKTKYISKGWSAISLQGYGESISDILKPNVLGSKTPSDTIIKTNIYDDPKLESIRTVLDNIPSDKERVRLMKLNSGCTIKPHTDRVDKDFVNGKIIRIHVPLTSSDVVYHEWNLGKKQSCSVDPENYYLLNVNNRHMVENQSDKDRINLVIDVFVNKEINTLLSQLEN